MNQTETTNRRPLKSRGSWWSRYLMQILVSYGITPNQVSLASMSFAALACLSLFFYRTYHDGWSLIIFAIIGIQGRLLCNLLDGMLAIESQRKSKVGELYNDIPDRISDTLIFIGSGLSFPENSSHLLSGATLGVIATILALLTAYIRVLGVSLGTPHFFAGPMAKQHRMATFTMGLLLAGYFTNHFLILAITLWIIIIGSFTTCLRRIKMITNYIETNR